MLRRHVRLHVAIALNVAWLSTSLNGERSMLERDLKERLTRLELRMDVLEKHLRLLNEQLDQQTKQLLWLRNLVEVGFDE
jgi:hypothetical protein